MQTLFHVFL